MSSSAKFVEMAIWTDATELNMQFMLPFMSLMKIDNLSCVIYRLNTRILVIRR